MFYNFIVRKIKIRDLWKNGELPTVPSRDTTIIDYHHAYSELSITNILNGNDSSVYL